MTTPAFIPGVDSPTYTIRTEIHGRKFMISYCWISRHITFTQRDDVSIQGDFKVDRPFASREPSDFLLAAEVQEFIGLTPAERAMNYDQINPIPFDQISG